MAAAIQTQGLTKVYRSRRREVRALHDVDLRIEEGETFGLLGPNGAGKTTFVKCLLGSIRPTDGSIEMLGRDAADPQARSGVGFAPEIPGFPGFLSGPEIMRLHGRLIGLGRDQLAVDIERLLREAGLAEAPNRTKAYSKGMVRRLAVAQAMLGNPDVLILDEPTADLDPIGRREVRVRLEALKAEGTTILLNSHLLSEVERICDRVAILYRGEVLALGTIKELVPEGKDLEDVFVDLVEQAGAR